ncbi:MAG: hypothetical protein IJ704_04690 [Bacilli bacterium]|nr:hypothetical protein [Bacilli bacterium]
MKRKKIDCPYQSKDITRDVISKFCEIKKIENLNLAVDRFDQMNGSSKYVQQIYNRYFGLFHKVILSSEDKDLNPKILSYRIKKVTYGMDKEVLKQIIKHREFFYKEQENYGGCIYSRLDIRTINKVKW